MKTNGMLPLLVGFFGCGVFALGVSLFAEVRERRYVANRLEAVELVMQKAEAENAAVRKVALNALQLEQVASQERATVDDKIAGLEKELQKRITDVSRTHLVDRLEDQKRWRTVDEKFSRLDGAISSRRPD